MYRITPWTLLLLLALPSIATARQTQQEVARQRFTFLANQLLIRVAADVPGTLRILRGEGGILEVGARAVPTGMPGFGLSGTERDELNLTALGADQVEYLVVVPRGIRVRIRLPDRNLAEVMPSTHDVATYRWDRSPGGPDR